MKKIYYNKLIRDFIPAKIMKNGASLKYFILKQKDFEKELIKKVEEEASALPHCKNRKELIAELADVLNVTDEIKRVKKISAKELRSAQKNNMRRKGGFKKRFFLIWSSDTGYRTNEKRGKKSS